MRSAKDWYLWFHGHRGGRVTADAIAAIQEDAQEPKDAPSVDVLDLLDQAAKTEDMLRAACATALHALDVCKCGPLAGIAALNIRAAIARPKGGA